jgi:DNA-binding MarR family transcriptional regulator
MGGLGAASSSLQSGFPVGWRRRLNRQSRDYHEFMVRSEVTESGPGGARWLNDEERAAWLGVMAIILKLPAALDSQLTRSAKLTLFEYLLLARLSEQPGLRLRMSTLATLTNGSLSRLSHVAERLEARGLLYRERDPENGRYMMAVLTTAGRELVIKAAPGHVQTVRELLIDALTPDQLRALEGAGANVLAKLDSGRSWPS